ncbi:MAG: hypothetical protein QOH31_3560 [Verrucomicrobiota bacterium]
MRRSWGCYRPVCRCPSTVPFIADGTPPVRSSTLESGGAALIPIKHKPNPADPNPSTPITAKRRRFNCRTRADQVIRGRTCVLGYLGCGAIPSIRSVYIPTPGKTLWKNYRGMETRLHSNASCPILSPSHFHLRAGGTKRPAATHVRKGRYVESTEEGVARFNRELQRFVPSQIAKALFSQAVDITKGDKVQIVHLGDTNCAAVL